MEGYARDRDRYRDYNWDGRVETIHSEAVVEEEDFDYSGKKEGPADIDVLRNPSSIILFMYILGTFLSYVS